MDRYRRGSAQLSDSYPKAGLVSGLVAWLTRHLGLGNSRELVAAPDFGEPAPRCTDPAELERCVSALELRYHLTLPDDFRLHLLQFTDEQERMDDRNFNWWPAHRVKNLPDECGSEVHQD